MTSLIFWGPYLAHKGIINHRREKQRIKNYERWEGLRDEYDEQHRVTRESRSLDIQRTGPWEPSQRMPYEQEEPRAIFSLRDQQEANDARTGWRPQESWDPPKTQLPAQMTGQVYPNTQRHESATPAMHSPINNLPLRSQKTGATWDEGLPAPLQVSRRSFDDYEYPRAYRSAALSAPGSRQPSQSRGDSMSRQASVSRTHTPSGLRESTPLERQFTPPDMNLTTVQGLPKNEFGFVEPVRQVAGGRMAELIERGY